MSPLICASFIDVVLIRQYSKQYMLWVQLKLLLVSDVMEH